MPYRFGGFWATNPNCTVVYLIAVGTSPLMSLRLPVRVWLSWKPKSSRIKMLSPTWVSRNRERYLQAQTPTEREKARADWQATIDKLEQIPFETLAGKKRSPNYKPTNAISKILPIPWLGQRSNLPVRQRKPAKILPIPLLSGSSVKNCYKKRFDDSNEFG